MRNLIKSIRTGHPGTLFSSFLYFDVSFMVWILLGPLSVFIAADLNLSPGRKGLLVAIPILSGAALRIFMGFLSDHVGPKKIGMAGLALTLLPLSIGWLAAHTFTAFCAVGILLGVAGSSFAVALPLASRWYPREHQGLVMGIAGAGNSGTAIAALLAPRLAERFGWNGVFGIAMIPVTIVFIIFVIFAKEVPGNTRPAALFDHFKVLREGDCWWFNFFYSISFGGFVGLASYLVIFFHDEYHLSRVMAGNLTALCVFSGSLVRPFGGYLADRFGGTSVLTFLFPLVGLCLIGVGMGPAIGAAVGLFVISMACLGMANGSVFQIVPQRFRDEIGIVTGIVGASGGVGGFFLPTLLGGLKGRLGTAAPGLMIFGSIAIFAAALLQAIYRWSWKSTWLADYLPSPVLSTGRVQMVVAYND